MSATHPLRILILAEDPVDADLLGDALAQADIEAESIRVENETDYVAQLSDSLDLILAGDRIPRFNTAHALQLLQARGLDIPFIVVAGAASEEYAVECMKQGAADYLQKDRLARLGPAVTKALADKAVREDRRRLEDQLKMLHTAVEQSGSSVVITDLQGNIEYVNPKFTEVTGYASDEVMGKNPRILKSGETPSQAYKQLWETILAGGEYRAEFHNRKKNGDLFWESATISAIKDSKGRVTGFLAVKEDITERKQVEEEIRSLALFPEENPRPVLRVREDGILLYANEAGQSLLATLDTAIGGSAPALWQNLITDALASHSSKTIDFWYRNETWSLFAAPILNRGYVNLYGVEITERRRAEEDLVASEMRYRRLFETAKDGIMILDATTGHVLDINPFLLDLLGYTPEEILGKQLWEIGLFKDILGSQTAFRELQDKGYIRYENLPLETRDGRQIAVEFVSNVYLVNDAKVIQCNVRDITARRRAENSLEAERNLMRTLIDNLPDRIYAKDADGRFTLKNAADARQMGVVSGDEVIGKTDFDFYPSELAEQYNADDQTVIRSGQALINREEPFINSDGIHGWMLTSKVPLRDAQGKVTGLVGIGRDISERKVAEEQLRKLNRTLTVLSEVNRAIVGIHPTVALFEKICRIAVDSGGFRMAWVGLLDAATSKVNPVGSAGVTDDYLEKLAIQMNDEVRRGGPTGIALRMGQKVIVNDVEHDPRMAPWRKDALRLGYRAVMALPLDVAGEARGTLNLYADRADFFDEAEVELLDEMTADISFAMEFAEQEAQRKAAETALQIHMQAVEDMRLFLQTTLDAFPANTVVLDPTGKIINVNAPWQRFAAENDAPSLVHYLGANYLEVCDKAAGPGSEHAAPAAEGIRAVIEGQQDAFHLDYPCHNASEQRWFSLRVTPFPEPIPRRVVVAHLNITERLQAEEKLQAAHDTLEERVRERTRELRQAKEHVEAILKNSSDGILVTGHGKLLDFNPALCQMLGIEADEITIESLTEAIVPDERPRILEAVAALGRTHTAQRLAVDIQQPMGAIVHVDVILTSLSSDDENLTSILGNIRDVSKQKQIEKSLRDTLEKEKELGEIKSRLISMASHDFRTPLAIILSSASLLETSNERMTAEQREKHYSKIQTSVNRMTLLLEDVLTYSKADAGRVTVAPEYIDIETFCAELAEEIDANHTHILRFTFQGTEHGAFLDRKLLRQILLNLLSNAVKYSAPESTVYLDWAISAHQVIFTVKDEGLGIPDKDLPYLFDTFHRGSNTGAIPGTGLGLAIVKKDVDLQGGSIDVDSEIGVGTTFTVTIPIAAESEK